MTKQYARYKIAGKKVYDVTCDSCQVMVINGHICHERGCPDAWKDEIRECKACGCEFHPDNDNQQFCDDNCYNMYYGYPTQDDYDFLSEEQLYPD